MANMLRARVTDAFGNTLAGQTVSVTAGNGATVTPTVTTQPDGTVEISVTSQTAGISTVTATINNSSLSRNVTFVADVRTAKIADLVVIKDGSVADGAMAEHAAGKKVTDANGNVLAGQTVSMMAGNGATAAPTVITEPDGTVEILSPASQTAGASAVTASINSSNASRNVTYVADVRTAKIADLVVIERRLSGRRRNGEHAAGEGHRCVRQCAWRTDGQRDGRQRRNGCPDGDHRAGRHGGDQCHQPDGGSQCSHRQHQQQQPEPGCDVYRRYQDGADQRSGGH